MRALITGGAGFIGSHLTDALLAAGWEVAAIDNFATGSRDNLLGCQDHPSYHFVEGDILTPGALDDLLPGTDVIFHLAAAVGVELIVAKPVQTIQTNIMGTESVLRAAREIDCRVVIASTSEVYGKSEKFPFHEDDDLLLGPTNKRRWAYAASKLVDEFLALAYASEYDLSVVICRFFNTVGARQTGRYGMVLPRLVGQASRGEPLTVYDDGEQSRCFCAVQDVVRAVVGLATNADATGQVVNIGSQEEISIFALAERICKVTGSASEIVLVPYAEAYAPGFEDMRRRVPDTRRIQQLLDWLPEVALDDIIRQVADTIP